MHPVLVQLGPLTIRWYGVMMAVLILASISMARCYGPRFGVPPATLDRVILPVILFAFVGMRLAYVLSHPAQFHSLVEISRVDRGGLASHGAVAGAMLAVWFLSRRHHLPTWDLSDTIAWTVPLGHLFIRFGNFMNGELYGDVTTVPWAVRFPNVPGPRHPLQLYEMGIAAVVLIVALGLARKRAFPGQLSWTVLVLSSIGRIMMDLFRSDARAAGIVTLGQIAATLLIVVGTWFLVSRSRLSGDHLLSGPTLTIPPPPQG